MNTKDLVLLGAPVDEATQRVTVFVARYILGGGNGSRLGEEVTAIAANPLAFADDGLRGEFVKALLNAAPPLSGETLEDWTGKLAIH